MYTMRNTTIFRARIVIALAISIILAGPFFSWGGLGTLVLHPLVPSWAVMAWLGLILILRSIPAPALAKSKEGH